MWCPQSNKERKVILEYGAITLYGAPFQGASFNNLPKWSPSAVTIYFLTIQKINNAPDVKPIQPLVSHLNLKMKILCALEWLAKTIGFCWSNTEHLGPAFLSKAHNLLKRSKWETKFRLFPFRSPLLRECTPRLTMLGASEFSIYNF